jgi:hypothetical protein
MATLNSDKVVVTLERLQDRVAARFPDSGLSVVAGALVAEARLTAHRAEAIARPYPVTRLFVCVVIVLIAGVAAELWWLGGAAGLDWIASLKAARTRGGIDPLNLAAGLESVVNLAILGSLSIWFLINSEARAKRKRTLTALHGLRSLAHVIDMHQLTKDPTVVLARRQDTAASPTRSMDQFQLTRYLDYCAEMLALIGKLAALYAARTQDPQVITAVNDIETLCTDLSRKIWQKITILSALDERASKPA